MSLRPNESPGTANTPSPRTAVVFDLPASLEQIGGEPALLETLIDAYFEQEPALLERLVSAVAEGDALGIRKAAHALASSVGVLCAIPARDAAKRIEEMGRAGELTDTTQALASLLKEFASLRQALEAARARHAA